MIKLLLFFLFFLNFTGCTENEVETVVETSCTTATGLWTVSSIRCNEQATSDLALIYLLFDKNGGVSQTQGNNECASTFNWETTIGEDVPSFDMAGTGQLSCSSNGNQVDSCTTPTNSCNSLVSLDGITNNYGTCVIVNGQMQLSRQVSPVNNPDNFSFCKDGETEEVTLELATDLDLDPIIDDDLDPDKPSAILVINNPNPTDFGSIAPASQHKIQFTLSNKGTSEATQLSVNFLSAPFSFVGSQYPGTGGTCGDTLAAEKSCLIVIQFAPLTEGLFTSNLDINYSSSDQKKALKHNIIGTSTVNLGILSISDGPFYDFGILEVDHSKIHLFTLKNSGKGTVSDLSSQELINPYSFTGENGYPGENGTCSVALKSGSECTLEIMFQPTASGAYNSVLTIDFYDGFYRQQKKRNIFGAGQQ